MLNSKQRAYLRGLANPLESIFQLGKGGINDEFITQIDQALTKRELIKVSVLETSPVKAREAAGLVAEQTGAEPVQVIGGKFVLYRANKKLENSIKLPR